MEGNEKQPILLFLFLFLFIDLFFHSFWGDLILLSVLYILVLLSSFPFAPTLMNSAQTVDPAGVPGIFCLVIQASELDSGTVGG